jgi:hypothetical protein
MAPQEGAELRGATEWVRDRLASAQTDCSVDAAFPNSDEVGARRERAGVELGEALQRGAVGGRVEA